VFAVAVCNKYSMSVYVRVCCVLLVSGQNVDASSSADSTRQPGRADAAVDTAAAVAMSASQYNVEHRVIMDSDGAVRVQITKFVKIGSDDDDDDDAGDDELMDEGEFDFGSEVEKLFRAMEDVQDVDVADPNPFGVNPNMLPGKDGRPSDVRSMEGHPDEHDRVRMNLVDDGMATDPQHVRIHRNGERGWESTTAVVRASHVIRRDAKRSSVPPRSVFAKLAPSRDRYTILRDEL